MYCSCSDIDPELYLMSSDLLLDLLNAKSKAANK